MKELFNYEADWWFMVGFIAGKNADESCPLTRYYQEWVEGYLTALQEKEQPYT